MALCSCDSLCQIGVKEEKKGFGGGVEGEGIQKGWS